MLDLELFIEPDVQIAYFSANAIDLTLKLTIDLNLHFLVILLQYEFTDSDKDFSLLSLQMLCADAVIPWDELMYMVGEV